MTTKQAAKVILKMMDRFARTGKSNPREVKAMKIAVYVLAGIHAKNCKACTARLECVEFMLGNTTVGNFP
jgi:hypothetical protein